MPIPAQRPGSTGTYDLERAEPVEMAAGNFTSDKQPGRAWVLGETQTTERKYIVFCTLCSRFLLVVGES